MAPKIEKLTDSYPLGECPHWDVASQSLYFVDILSKKIIKYNPATKATTHASTAPQQPSFIIPVEGTKDRFIISLDKELAIVTWDGESDTLLKSEKLAVADDVPERANNKFSSGKCDSSGRLWAGTLDIDVEDLDKTLPVGTLYSFDTKRGLKANFDKIRLSSGIAFSTKSMFHDDCLKQTVDRFDFDIDDGTVSNRQVWFTPAKHNIPGLPDGMTIDADGNLWVAIHDGSRVIKISGSEPETLLYTIIMPAQKITSVTFGGQHLDELYITTASFGQEQTENGAVYRVTGVGARGLPAADFLLD